MTVNGLTWQEGDEAVAREDYTAEERIVLKWNRPEHIYILCASNKCKGEGERAETEEITNEESLEEEVRGKR